MNLGDYQFNFGFHRNKQVIWIKFPYNQQLKSDLKLRFPSAKWSHSEKTWYLPDLSAVRTELGLKQKNTGDKLLLIISTVNKSAFEAYREQLILKGYSTNTLKMYLSEFAHLLILLGDYNVNDLTPKRLKDYFLYCVVKLKMKERKMNGKINAVKFYFESVLHQQKMFFDIPRPKKPSQLPKMLSKLEVKKVLTVLSNKKHLLVLKLCYGMGLRLSEICNLKLSDIDSDRMQVLIEASKGKKDRYVALPNSVLPELRMYYKLYKPKYWLF